MMYVPGFSPSPAVVLPIVPDWNHVFWSFLSVAVSLIDVGDTVYSIALPYTPFSIVYVNAPFFAPAQTGYAFSTASVNFNGSETAVVYLVVTSVFTHSLLTFCANVVVVTDVMLFAVTGALTMVSVDVGAIVRISSLLIGDM